MGGMTHTEKKKIIEKLVTVPKKQKRVFWGREIKSLNILMETYPHDTFWKSLTFSNMFDSIVVLRSGYYAGELKTKYNLFNYKLPEKELIKLGAKTGEDFELKNKPKTIKSFLS